MPIWLRKFTFNEIKNHYEELNNPTEGTSNNGGKQTVINSDGTIKTPELIQKAVNAKRPVKYS